MRGDEEEYDEGVEKGTHDRDGEKETMIKWRGGGQGNVQNV
jgi:hypothetical protein